MSVALALSRRSVGTPHPHRRKSSPQRPAGFGGHGRPLPGAALLACASLLPVSTRTGGGVWPPQPAPGKPLDSKLAASQEPEWHVPLGLEGWPT